MRNIWLVAQHEFLTNIRKRSFLFAVFGVPILMCAIFAVTIFVQIAAEETGLVADSIGYVDQANVIDLENEQFLMFEDIDLATLALDNEEIDTFFVITPLYLQTGDVRLYSYGQVSEETRDAIEVFIVENLTSNISSDIPPERLIDPINADIYVESLQRELTFEGVIGLFLTPIIFAVVLLMALQLSSTFLMAGVIEEKSNHIMEILITSITPYQLLSGKLLGLGALGLIQILIWIAVGLVGATYGGNIEFLSGIILPFDFVIVVLIYFILTYFLYSSLLAGIGAVVGSEQESRTIAGAVSMLTAIPFFFFSVLIMNPESPIFTVLMYFPFTAGMTYMMKYPFVPISLSEVLISLSILAVSTALVTWAAAKVFRWALLLYGKNPSIMTLFRVITGNQEIGVTSASSNELEQSA
ncbi:MAG: ABC transporter permease [Phototrophicaceae bacterium]